MPGSGSRAPLKTSARANDDQVHPPLRLGDVILLFCKEKDGFVYSDVSSKKVQSVTVRPVNHPFSTDDPNLPDIFGGCFRVLAANKHKAVKNLADLKEEFQGKKLNHNKQQQLRVAERNAESENLENDVEQERVKGNTVAYGNSVQLLHLYTGKYLTVNSTNTSSLESTNLRMELCTENSPDCIFRILPRYKVRSVGDEVLAKDQVTFESLETKGQYLHCSRKTLGATGSHLHSTYYELNLSGTESSFTVLPHSHVLDVPPKSETLWAGGVFRLFHREIECYLVADGSFADVDADRITEDVHLRKRRSVRGQLKAPSTSAITYWRIEKQRNPLSGEAMRWGESCRIRHLLTRQYLTIVNGGEGVTISLANCTKESEFDSAATFRLRPVIQGEDSIMYGSFARIYHPTTDTWLHAMKGEKYERKGVTSGESEGLQWDGADLFKISAKPEMGYDDAFALIKVEQNLLTQFNFIAGIVPILKTYLSEIQEGKKGHKSVKASVTVTEQALLELASFMLDPYARKKDRQKLVRNLKVLELLVQILKLFNPQSSDSKLQRQVCIAAYRVIEVFLQGNSRKNELYLSRFIPYFQKQIGVGLNAESMLIELIRDNILIVSLYNEKEIGRLINLLLKSGEEKDSRFLDFLGVLCVCEGKACVPTQEFVMKELLIERGQELFWPTKVAGCEVPPDYQDRVVYQDAKNGEWKLLADIAPKTATKKKLSFTSPWHWLESQLDLFGKLAKGNNTKVINAITKELEYITFEEALAGARDPELHPSIRIKYVDLIVVLFVDVGNNRSVLETLPNTFVYSEIVENPFANHKADATLALTGEVNPHFPRLRDWILDVAQKKELICSEDMKEDNLLLAQILGVCELLVKFGYYNSCKDIKNVIEPLKSMLDGTTDTNPPRISPEDFKAKRRFKKTSGNRAVFAVKVKIMRIFDFFFNYRVYLRLQRFMFSYRCLNDDTVPSPVPKRHGRVQHDPSQAVYVNIEASETDDVFGTEPCLHATTDTAWKDSKVSQPPPKELKELLTMKGKGSLKATIVRRHLLEIFSETAFFEDEELNPREQALVKVLLDLSKYDDNEMVVWSIRLLNRYFSSATDIFERAIDAQLLLTKESTNVKKMVVEKVNEARKKIQHELDSQSIEVLKGGFKQLRRLCFMNEELSRPHPQNQRILLNHGILPEVLNLILHCCKDYKFDNTPDPMNEIESLFLEVLRFLTAFARGHRVVQEQLFARLDSLLVVPFAVADLASLVREVFTNYHELCVKAKESHVEQIFRLVVTTKDPNGQAELLQALKAMTITRVDDIDLPVKRNQKFVMKYFSRNKEFFEHILGDEGNEETKRMDLLLSGEKTDPRLILLLNVVDLLAVCCQGRNIFVQSICQTVMSDHELLKILTNERIEIARKKPFCLYLVWVYLDSDSQTSNPGYSNALEISDEVMVEFMRLSCQHMIDVREMLSKLPSDQPPQPAVVKYLRYSLLGDQSDVEDTSIRGIDLQPGSLVYLLDSLLPFFRLYYWEWMSLSSEVVDLLELIRHVARCLLVRQTQEVL